MLALRNFIQFGVTWQGDTNDVKFMQTRAARVILMSLADQTSTKNTAASLKKSRQGLSGYLYQRSTVSGVLMHLKTLGLVERERAGRKGDINEDFAPTKIVEGLVVAALQWQKQCRKLRKNGKKGEDARPDKTTIWIPPKSTPPSGEPSLAGVVEDQLPNSGLVSYQKLETVSLCTLSLSLPPLLLPFERNFRGGRGRETLPPVSSLPPAPELIPRIINFGDSQIFKNFRPFPTLEDCQGLQNFINWLSKVNEHDDLTAVSLMQAGAPGKLEIYKKKSVRLTSADPFQMLIYVYAKSRGVFEKTGMGEQLYFSPRPGSRVILMDDIKTAQPLFEGHQCAILETSADNYQHFYVCEKGLEQPERHQLQAQLVSQFGGDPKATNGHQPHRTPGSVNYKKGRNCFVTRLVFCEPEGAVLAAPVEAVSPPFERDRDTRLFAPCVGGLKSPSEIDWAWTMSNWLLGEKELTRLLLVSSVRRGKHKEYAARTVESVALFRKSRGIVA